jgi:hypothetical protein
MTEEVKPSVPITLKVLDADKAAQLFQEVKALREWHLQNAASETDRTLQIHRDGASFYEKLAILDAGVLVFFLNFLMAHPTGSAVTKASFWGLFCPAGVLLLLALYLSGMRIIGIHQINRLIAMNLSQLQSKHRHEYLGILCTKISVVLEGTLERDTGTIVDVSQHFAAMPVALKKEADDQELVLKKERQELRKTDVQARLALLFTMMAILLLCFFTVRVLSL